MKIKRIIIERCDCTIWQGADKCKGTCEQSELILKTVPNDKHHCCGKYIKTVADRTHHNSVFHRGIYLVVALIMALSTGCASSVAMVMTRGNAKSSYAPTNESRGGVIKYALQSPAKQAADRELAYKRMAEFCGGPYAITSEGQHSGPPIALAVPTVDSVTTFPMSLEYVYLNFDCEVKP